MSTPTGSKVDAYRKLAGRALADYRHAVASVKDERAGLADLKAAEQIARDGQTVLQLVAHAVQEKAIRQIEKVVTHAIRTVGWDYDFKLKVERKRGKTEAKPVFVRDGHEVDPRYGAGGGVTDVAAFALRLIVLKMSTPKLRQLVVLDEPFRGINGEEYRRRAAELVERLAADLNVQVVLATGHDWLRIGEVKEL